MRTSIRLFFSVLLGLSTSLVFLLTLSSVSTVFAASITVNSLADDIDNDGECTLREAIIAANNDASSGAAGGECAAGSGSDTINFSITGIITLTSTLPEITSTLLISGPGISSLSISGANLYRVFKVTAGDVTFSSMTIANGFIDGSDGRGGGIFNSSPGTMTLDDVVIFNNQSRGANGLNAGGSGGCCFGGGGGIFHSGVGILNIINSSFLSNTAVGGSGGAGTYGGGGGGGGGSFGGALFNDGGFINILTTTFSTNQSLGGSGGSGGGGSGGTGGGGGGQGGGSGGNFGNGSDGSGLGGGGGGGAYNGSGGNGSFGGGGGGNAYGIDTPSTGGFGGGNGDHGGGGGGGFGAGIFNNSGTIVVTNSNFIGNVTSGGAGGGGNGSGEKGRGLGGAIFNRDSLSVTNSSFSNNKASDGSGGGIYNLTAKSVAIISSTFTSNQARGADANSTLGGCCFGGGGGIFHDGGGVLNVSSSIFTGNLVTGGNGGSASGPGAGGGGGGGAFGGGLFNNNGTVNLVETLFSSNEVVGGNGGNGGSGGSGGRGGGGAGQSGGHGGGELSSAGGNGQGLGGGGGGGQGGVSSGSGGNGYLLGGGGGGSGTNSGSGGQGGLGGGNGGNAIRGGGGGGGGLGGGVFNLTGVLNVTNSTFDSNHTSGGLGGSGAFTSGSPGQGLGGGIFNQATINITDTNFINNEATGGGGLYHNGSSLTLTGGQFIGNTANDGAGLYQGGGNGRIVNTLLARNLANNNGAGLYLNSPGNMEVVHTTIASPTLSAKQGIYVASGTANITNTIISSHTIGIAQTSGTVWEDYNLFFGNTLNKSSLVYGGSNDRQGNPNFVVPSANNYHLGIGSAAVDVGIDAGITNDFDDDSRPFGYGFDIGADESPFFAETDLVLIKSVTPTIVAPGQLITYTLIFSNNGLYNANDVIISDTIPSTLTNLSITNSGVGITQSLGVTFAWQVADMAMGDKGTITITGIVSPDLSVATSFTNTAIITTTTVDTNIDNNKGIAQTSVQGANLLINKVAFPNPVYSEGSLRYTLNLTNTGPDIATAITVTDILPSEVTFEDISNNGWSCNTPSNVITCTRSSLAVGVAPSIIITVSAPITGGVITNVASVNSATFDPDSSSNFVSITTTILPPQADLSLEKTVNNASPSVGSTIVFTLEVFNNGPNAATNVQVKDLLPFGLSYQSHNGGIYNKDTGIWTIGSLDSGYTATLRITAQLIIITPVTNTAQIVASDQFDPDSTPNNNASNEDDQSSIIIMQPADLSLSKVANNTAPSPGSTVIFTLSVKNDGPNMAENIQVKDLLPAGLLYQSHSGGTYNKDTGIWNVGDLGNGNSATLQINTQLVVIVPVTNTAQIIASDQADPDSIPNNNNPSEDDYAKVVIGLPQKKNYLPLILKGQ